MAEDDKTDSDKAAEAEEFFARLEEAQARFDKARSIGRPKAVESLRRRLSQRPDIADLWGMIRDFHGDEPPDWVSHEDRAGVLLIGSALDQALESAILTHCIELDREGVRLLFGGGDHEPLSSATKVRLGYALGIYGEKSRKDLDLMRVIRNTFAHSKSHIDFDDLDIVAACANLTFVERVTWGGLIGPKPESAKDEFTWAAQFYFLYLTSAYQGRITKPLRYKELANSETYS
jgi:hypothetical protein